MNMIRKIEIKVFLILSNHWLFWLIWDKQVEIMRLMSNTIAPFIM
ncbi:hypothetical protein J41TS12_30520 [Paenibacillus antibioticophila]|uniref:Uncharacterized protein n=1 Tax=Paenibacillus antibioticophila TaxID=1274374 RepID=A0A919XTK3_9BACL|nr:hypothetical protein J41TS12_30520 [Paenibacillus antibioticophila]